MGQALLSEGQEEIQRHLIARTRLGRAALRFEVRQVVEDEVRDQAVIERRTAKDDWSRESGWSSSLEWRCDSDRPAVLQLLTALALKLPDWDNGST